MTVTWNNKYTESEIEKLLEEAKVLKLSQIGLGIHSILATALDFHEDVLYKEAEILVLQALHTLSKHRINKLNFLKEINKRESIYLRQSKNNYHVVTNISINPKCQLRPIIFDNIEIRFYGKEPSKYKRREFIGEIIKILHSPELPKDYKAVVISVCARSEYEAGAKALECLDFILATWNFALNYSLGKTQYLTTNKPLPINKIIKGPIHTIHLTSGEPTTERVYYYEPDYYGPIQSYDNTKHIKNIKKFESKVKSIIKKNNKWGNRIRNGLIRYTRALEKHDHISSFLELWSILELLTLTSSNENYKEMVRKISNLYADSEIHKSFINFIRHIRNSLVHHSEFNFHRTNLTYEIKEFVEGLILYHFAAIYIFDNYEDAIQFIDLPNDENEIKKRIKLLKRYYKTRFGNKS